MFRWFLFACALWLGTAAHADEGPLPLLGAGGGGGSGYLQPLLTGLGLDGNSFAALNGACSSSVAATSYQCGFGVGNGYMGSTLGLTGFKVLPTQFFNHAVSGTTAVHMLYDGLTPRNDLSFQSASAYSMSGGTLTITTATTAGSSNNSGLNSIFAPGVQLAGASSLSACDVTAPQTPIATISPWSSSQTGMGGSGGGVYQYTPTSASTAATFLCATVNPSQAFSGGAIQELYWNQNEPSAPQAAIFSDTNDNLVLIEADSNPFNTTTFPDARASIACDDEYLNAMGPNGSSGDPNCVNQSIAAQNKVILADDSRPAGISVITGEVHAISSGAPTFQVKPAGTTFGSATKPFFFACENYAYYNGGSENPSAPGAKTVLPVLVELINTASGASEILTASNHVFSTTPSIGQFGTDANGNYYFNATDATSYNEASVSYCYSFGGTTPNIPSPQYSDLNAYWNSSAPIFTLPSGPVSTYSGALYQRPWVHVVPTWEYMVDPTSGANYWPIGGLQQSGGGAHPSPDGGVLIGKNVIAPVMASVLSGQSTQWTPNIAAYNFYEFKGDNTHGTSGNPITFNLSTLALANLNTAAGGFEVCDLGTGTSPTPICAVADGTGALVSNTAGAGGSVVYGTGAVTFHESAAVAGNNHVVAFGSPPFDASGNRLTGKSFLINGMMDWGTSTGGGLTAGGALGNMPTPGTGGFNCNTASGNIGTANSNWIPQGWTLSGDSGLKLKNALAQDGTGTNGWAAMTCGYVAPGGTIPNTNGWTNPYNYTMFWVQLDGVFVPTSGALFQLQQSSFTNKFLNNTGTTLTTSDPLRTGCRVVQLPGANGHVIGAESWQIKESTNIGSPTPSTAYGSGATTGNAINLMVGIWQENSPSFATFTDNALIYDGNTSVNEYGLTHAVPTNNDQGTGAPAATGISTFIGAQTLSPESGQGFNSVHGTWVIGNCEQRVSQ